MSESEIKVSDNLQPYRVSTKLRKFRINSLITFLMIIRYRNIILCALLADDWQEVGQDRPSYRLLLLGG